MNIEELVNKLPEMNWRQHGLGMLQAELSIAKRVHIWHPDLRFVRGIRDVHDHRFDLESEILFGEITDVRYNVTMNPPHPNAAVWTIKHAKIQSGGEKDVQKLGDCHAAPNTFRVYRVGESYAVRRREFHTTRIDRLAITLVSRSNFDDQPARILSSVGMAPESAVPRQKGEWTRYIEDARSALLGL